MSGPFVPCVAAGKNCLQLGFKLLKQQADSCRITLGDKSQNWMHQTALPKQSTGTWAELEVTT